MTEFTAGFVAGLDAAAGLADFMGGDRYQRPDWSRRDPHGRLQQTIEARASSTTPAPSMGLKRKALAMQRTDTPHSLTEKSK